MKMILLISFTCLSLALQAQKANSDITYFVNSWVQAMNNEDLVKFSSLSHDEVVVFKQGEPLKGIQSVKDYYQGMFDAYKIELSGTVLESESFGNSAYVWCMIKGSIEPENGCETITIANNNLWILSKDDGNWKFKRAMAVSALE